MLWNKTDDLSKQRLRILKIGNTLVNKPGSHCGTVVRQFVGSVGMSSREANTLIRFEWDDFGVNELFLSQIEFELLSM